MHQCIKDVLYIWRKLLPGRVVKEGTPGVQRHLPFLANEDPDLGMLGHDNASFTSVSIRSCARRRVHTQVESR